MRKLKKSRCKINTAHKSRGLLKRESSITSLIQRPTNLARLRGCVPVYLKKMWTNESTIKEVIEKLITLRLSERSENYCEICSFKYEITDNR